VKTRKSTSWVTKDPELLPLMLKKSLSLKTPPNGVDDLLAAKIK
jgi:hypothetical protein